MKKTRWLVIGTGYIAGEFARGMRVVEDGEIAAVVSRKVETAQRYAHEFGISGAYDDLKTALSEVKPDVVYVATPNDCHYEAIMTILDAGFPVLSEKPMADNMAQMEELVAKAKEKNLFLMEGMWTRCFPVVQQTKEWIRSGAIGNVMTLKCYFDICPDYEDWQPWKGGIAHAGGSLRDVGIYALGMANLVFPEVPEHIYGTHHFNGEVDDSCRMMLCYEDGKTAQIGAAFNQASSLVMEVVGDKGRILVGPEMYHPSEAKLIAKDGTETVCSVPYPETGFQYEIAEVQKALAEGKKECPLYTHAEMKLIGKIIEDQRKAWGIFYAADHK